MYYHKSTNGAEIENLSEFMKSEFKADLVQEVNRKSDYIASPIGEAETSQAKKSINDLRVEAGLPTQEIPTGVVENTKTSKEDYTVVSYEATEYSIYIKINVTKVNKVILYEVVLENKKVASINRYTAK